MWVMDPMTFARFFVLEGIFISAPYLVNVHLFCIFRQDIVLCRKHRGLADKIARERDSAQLQSEVVYWSGAWEVEEFLTSS